MLPKTLLILPLLFTLQIAFPQQKRELHIEINKVASGAKDTLWLTLSAGTSLGIHSGIKGNAVRVYNKPRDRDYNVLNMVTVVSATVNTSKAFLLLPADASAETFLLSGDQVGFRELEIPNGKNDVELFRKLAGFNIIFINSAKDAVFTQKEVFTSPDITSQQILKSLLTDIHESAQWLEDMSEKPASWTTPQTGGRFKGLGVLKAMRSSTSLDVETFIRFVNEYPGKYLGNKWKINETFATWVINNTPMPNSQEFVFEAFRTTPRNELSSWIKSNTWYIDSTFKASVDNAIGGYFVSSNTEGIKDLLDRTDILLQTVTDRDFETGMLINKGRLVTLQKGKNGNAEAQALYTQAININKNSANAYWYRGNIYSDDDANGLAIKDFTKVNELVPGFASAWGNTGWLLLKQYRVKEAEPFIRKAYALEPSSTAWNINLGHYFLFTGKTDSARKYYQRTLENMSTESELTGSLLADFDLFLKSGLFQDELIKEKLWMQNEFAGTYKHYLLADSFYNAATELKNKGDMKNAAILYGRSRTSEMNAKVQRRINVHNMGTWIGYVLTKDKQFAEAEKYYKEALTMARKELPNSVANDLDLISEMYTAWDKKALAESYKAETIALKEKMEEDTKEKNLFIVTIGVDKYKDVTYQGASADAKRIAEEFKSKGKGFKNVYAYVLTNQQASSDSIDATMQRIISMAGDWDTFIFYFTGKGVTKSGASYIIPHNFSAFNDDSLLKSKTISSGLLRSWSNSIAARHQFFLLDASTTLFPASFAAQPGRLVTTSQKDLSIISATFPRMENETGGSSLLAGVVFKLLSDSNQSSDRILTSKRIENYISENITRNNYYLGIEAFSQGRDFILANHNSAHVNVSSVPLRNEAAANVPVNNLRKRGAEVDQEEEISELSIGKRYALVIATDNYKDKKWPQLKNAVRDAKALENELQSNFGFETDHLYDATYTQIAGKLEEYSRKKFGKNDQLIILFSGHGFYDPRLNEGYLIPSDAQYAEIAYERHYMSFSSIVSNLRSVKSNHMLVLMDACHGGALVDKALMRDQGKDLYATLQKEDRIAAHLARPNRLILTSGRKDQTVFDGVEGLNSPFVTSILEALRSTEVKKTGILSYQQLMTTITAKQKTEAAEGRFGAEDNNLFMLEYQPNRVKVGADPTKFGGSK